MHFCFLLESRLLQLTAWPVWHDNADLGLDGMLEWDNPDCYHPNLQLKTQNHYWAQLCLCISPHWSWLSLLISLDGDNKMSTTANARKSLGVTLKQCHYCEVESRVQKLLISHLVLFQFGIVVESVSDVCSCVTWPASKCETEILAECTVDFQISCLIPQSQV